MEQEGVSDAPLQPGKKRVVASTSSEERQQIIDERVPKNTALATDFWVRSFSEYNGHKENPIDFKTAQKSAIADLLEQFYTDARKKDGSKYTRNSYLAARSALQRHLSTIQSDVKLFTCPEFRRANKFLDGLLKEEKAQRRGTVCQAQAQHY